MPTTPNISTTKFLVNTLIFILVTHTTNQKFCYICLVNNTKEMDTHKIKDYTERLKKETYSNAQKMLYMWIKQEVITLSEYRTLVENIEVIRCSK